MSTPTQVQPEPEVHAGDMNETARVPLVVEALVSAGLVDVTRRDEAVGVVARTLEEPAQRPVTSRSLLVEIAGYVGGALVIASVGLFLAQQWADFSETVQVAVLAAIAVLLAVAGLVVSQVSGGHAEMTAGRDEVRRRLSSALLIAAGVAAAFTVGRLVDIAQGDRFTDWPAFVGGLTAVVLVLAAYRYVPSLLGQAAVAFAAVTTTLSGWSLVDFAYDGSLWQGLTIMAVGALWVLVAEVGGWVETLAGRAIGAGLALLGAQMTVFGSSHDNLGYALMLAVAVLAFAMYMRKVAWPYLVVGVAGITLVVPEAIMDWTGDSLGPAGGVLVAGLTLLGASLAGFRMRQEATEPHDEHTGPQGDRSPLASR